MKSQDYIDLCKKIRKVWIDISFNIAISINIIIIIFIPQNIMPRKVQRIDPDFEFFSGQQDSQNGVYQFIPYETRISLIKLVFQEKVRIKSAAKSLGLKISTAKHILKSFRENGKIHRKRQERNMIFQEDLLQNQDLRQKILEITKQKEQKKAKKLKKKDRRRNQEKVVEQNIGNTVANEVPNINNSQKSIEGEREGEREGQYFQIFYEINFNHQYLIVDPPIQNISMMAGPDFYLVHPYRI